MATALAVAVILAPVELALAAGRAAGDVLRLSVFVGGLLAMGAFILGAVQGAIVWALERATRRLDAPAGPRWRALGYTVALSVVLSALWLGFLQARWYNLSGTTRALLIGGLLALQGVLWVAVRASIALFEWLRAGCRAQGRLPLALAAGLVGTSAVLYGLDRQLLPRLYPRFHAALALGCVVVLQLAAWVVFARRLRRPRWAAGRKRAAQVVLAAVLASAAIYTFAAFAQHGGLQVVVLQDTVLASKVVRGLRALSDGDGDGYSSLLGGGDCNDRNPGVHPGALDLPDNGLDEDCSGDDLTLAQLENVEAPAPVGDSDSLGSAVPRQRYNLLFLTIDALRADHLGFAGYPRPVSPNLDALARRGLVFANAYSASNNTGPSVPAIFTGQYPSTAPWQYARLGGHDWPIITDADNATLAELLREEGYRTGAISSMGQFFSFSQLQQGYDSVETPGGPALNQRAVAFMERPDADREPFFLWMHYDEPHTPYDAHREHDFGRRAIDRYDSEIAVVDARIGALLRRLDALGLTERTVVVVTSDHGEEFGDHGGVTHSSTLYEEQVRVPLVIAVPGLAPAVIDAPAEHVDILPTVLDVLAMPVPPQLDGRSLLMRPTDGADQLRWAYVEHLERDQLLMKAFVRDGWKVILDLHSNTAELYDLRSDPGERNNLADARPDVLRRMRAEAEQVAARQELVLLSRARVRGGASRMALARALPGIHSDAVLLDAVPLLAAVVDEEIPAHLAALARRPHLSADVLAQLFATLQDHDTDSAVRELIELAAGGPEAVRPFAIRALAGRNDTERIERLTRSRTARERAMVEVDRVRRREGLDDALALDPNDAVARRERTRIAVAEQARVTFDEAAVPATLAPGETSSVLIRVANAGEITLRPRPSESYPGETWFQLEWRSDEGDVVATQTATIPWLRPGETEQARLPLTAPALAGGYRLRIGLVYDGVELDATAEHNRFEASVEVVGEAERTP